jgi:hypothetical protein
MTSELRRVTLISAWVVGTFAAGMIRAAIIVPAGLSPGDTYQLAFVTSGTTAATSADIATYNTFVQNAANAAGMGSLTWSAIASTITVNASANAVVSTRVYNMGGELVANSYSDFWDGTHATGVGIDYNENNSGRNFNVWTGTQASGVSGGTGDALGEATPLWGESTFATSGWTAQGGNTNTTAYALYALSPVLSVPEPGAALLLGALAMGLLARRSRPLPRA